MLILQYFLGIVAAIGFVLIVSAPFNDFFREGWKTRIPIYGLKWRKKESWVMMVVGAILFLIGMIGLSWTWQ